MTRFSLKFRLVVPVLIAVLASVASSALALGVGTKAPEIGLADLAGKPVKLGAGDLQGKVVLVDFWASWCVPCREELPELERLYKKYKAEGLVVVGVNADKDLKNMTDFLRRTPLSFPVVHDVERKVAGRYAPDKMPSSYLVDHTGLVRYVQSGYKKSDLPELEAEIKKLLAKRGS